MTLASFPGRAPKPQARVLPIAACPLCGRSLSHQDETACTLGECRTIAEGEDAAQIERNRFFLSLELVEVEFSLLAIKLAIDVAILRGRRYGHYLEQRIPLFYLRTMLRGYVGDML